MRIFGLEFWRAKPEPITYLGKLAKLEINDGDTCVLMVPGPLEHSPAMQIKQQWEAAFDGKVKCIVVDNGITIGVLSQKATREADK